MSKDEKRNLPAVARERSLAPETWNALREAVFPAASDEMIAVAVDYCKARNLDPLKKPVHIVETWDSAQRKMVETIWPSITELRITATRTGEFAGKDETAYGPDIEESVGGIKMKYPEWCQVTVYRLVNGERCAFPGEKVYWKEAFAGKKGGEPNAMWKKRPYGQLAKCAEAAALRAAFPEEVGEGVTAEEMAGQAINIDHEDVSGGDGQDAPKPARPAPPPRRGVAAAKKTRAEPEKESEPAKKKSIPAKKKTETVVDGEFTEEPANEKPAEPAKEKPEEKSEESQASNSAAAPVTEIPIGKTHSGLKVTFNSATRHEVSGKPLLVLKATGDFEGTLYSWDVDNGLFAAGNVAEVTVKSMPQKSGKAAHFIQEATEAVEF